MTEQKNIRLQVLELAEANRQAHIDQGLYTAEEDERIRALPLKLPAPETSTMRRLEEVQIKVNESYDPTGLPEITSHRPGVGKFIVAGKRLIFKVLRFYSHMVLSRQFNFNRFTVEMFNEMVEAHRRSYEMIETVRADLELEIEGLAREMRKSFKEDRTRLEEHNQRLVRLGRRLKQAPTAEAAAGTGQAVSSTPPPIEPPTAGIDSLDYAAFEDRHRGTPEEVKAKQAGYVDLFHRAPGKILDLGCGRGEFLELLGQAGLEAYGIDLNPDSAAEVRDKGLTAEAADGLDHLAGLADESLGGLFMAQVIEHLPLPRLTALLEQAFRVLKPGGVIIAETINPQTLATFAGAFYIDPTHIKPIHPEGARFLLEASGFREVEIIPVNPFPEGAKLERIDLNMAGVDALNRNFGRLNDLLYGHQDYAAAGVK